MDLSDTDFEKLLELARLKVSVENKLKLRRSLDALMSKMIYINNPEFSCLKGRNT